MAVGSPPVNLVQQWINNGPTKAYKLVLYIAYRAAEWGAEQQRILQEQQNQKEG